MEAVEDEVYCEVHGCIHDRTTDPFGYGDAAPECGPDEWRKLWIGARVEKREDDVTTTEPERPRLRLVS